MIRARFTYHATDGNEYLVSARCISIDFPDTVEFDLADYDSGEPTELEFSDGELEVFHEHCLEALETKEMELSYE